MTVDLERRRAPAASVLRRRSRRAVARSSGGDRSALVLVGLVLLAGGALAALVGYGVLGAGRARRPLLDPVAVDAVAAQPLLARGLAIGAGLLLLVLGLVWTARSLRPERRPDLVLDRTPGTAITVSSAAAAEAVAGQAEGLPGVGRARVRLVGSEAAPALRLSLWLTEDADVRDVLDRLDRDVLAQARTALDLAALPAAVRLELDQPAAAPRVA
jgi:hypothetical protein